MRPLIAIVLLSLVTAVPASGGEQDKKKKESEPGEVDYLALAARLVRDGHYDRAAITLRKVDENDENIDKKRLFVLRGLVSLKSQLYVDAADNFEKAITAGASDPLISINLGRARFGQKSYREAAAALERAGDATFAQPQAAELMARAEWQSGDPQAAFETLRRASRRHPERIEFPRLEILFLVKLNLFQELASRRKSFLTRKDISADDLAAIGEALRRGGQLREAAKTLEAARLRFPDDTTLTIALASVLLDQGSPLSSAMLLERAARVDSKLEIEAAELYRRAGRLERALFLNQRVKDQKAKIKQRLQILLELERFEMIAAMEARLSRLGLLSDEQVRYALAYGYFQIRDFASAERHLKKLVSNDLFAKGIELRKAIEACREGGWRCH